MKSEDARKTWCERARVGIFTVQDNEIVTSGAYNRFEDGSIPPGAFCIAENCQMWDRADTLDPDNTEGDCGLKRRR